MSDGLVQEPTEDPVGDAALTKDVGDPLRGRPTAPAPCGRYAELKGPWESR